MSWEARGSVLDLYGAVTIKLWVRQIFIYLCLLENLQEEANKLSILNFQFRKKRASKAVLRESFISYSYRVDIA